MSTSTASMDLFDRRRFARVAYLGLFVALYYGTDLFVQYEALLWLAILGILVVFFDAVICARRRWRVVKSELSDDSEEEAEPNC